MDRGKDSYVLPSWFKNIVWLLATVISVVVSIMISSNKVQTDIAVLQAKYELLKEMYLNDIKEIQENLREIDKKLDNIE